MIKSLMICISWVSFLIASTAHSQEAPPQSDEAKRVEHLTAKDLVGTWALVSDTGTTRDGLAIQPFGRDPRGVAIFDGADHFAIVISRPDLPKFASNNRMHGTAEENESIVHGSFAFFGTYSVSGGMIIQHIDGGTWPAWTGTDQKRTVTSFVGDEQTWTTVPSFGGRSELHWKRLK